MRSRLMWGAFDPWGCKQTVSSSDSSKRKIGIKSLRNHIKWMGTIERHDRKLIEVTISQQVLLLLIYAIVLPTYLSMYIFLKFYGEIY